MKSLASFVCFLGAAFTVQAAEQPQCKQQTIEKSVIEMCLVKGAAFQHDFYTLKADKTLIFALVDDFSENVQLEHVIPEGEVLEFPLSMQGAKSVKIKGGCVPVSKDGYEAARVCNFFWGKYQIVKDVRFDFE
jgi:hypothetical protein